MNASDIVRLLNTNHYAPADLDEVNNICRNFPEFSIAHMLKVRIMEVLGYEKDKQLKVAAVYAMDRKILFQLVTEVNVPAVPEPKPEPEPFPEPTGAIQFSDDPNSQADVIIKQHAPYAGQEPVGYLLELDEEPEDAFEVVLDEEELTSETLITALVKDETEMEEPEYDSEGIPVMDVDEPKRENSSNNDLIRSFILDEPGVIRADKITSLKGDVSLSSIKEHDGFITDTLAKIYVKQGLFAKAIYAYEKLSLKYPEKSAYFAAQIEKIRNINHS
ncbi:MAG: hypothetical protein E4H10_12565 [Bacteroidia bacterium]|nr:MAG: hypothetical protein E4H10_12565 [Bacteroidia bacterium]